MLPLLFFHGLRSFAKRFFVWSFDGDGCVRWIFLHFTLVARQIGPKQFFFYFFRVWHQKNTAVCVSCFNMRPHDPLDLDLFDGKLNVDNGFWKKKKNWLVWPGLVLGLVSWFVLFQVTLRLFGKCFVWFSVRKYRKLNEAIFPFLRAWKKAV